MNTDADRETACDCRFGDDVGDETADIEGKMNAVEDALEAQTAGGPKWQKTTYGHVNGGECISNTQTQLGS